MLAGMAVSGCGSPATPPQTATPVPTATPHPSSTNVKEIVLVACEYSPYYSEHLENYGGISEIIVEAYKRVGYTVKIQFLPFARALNETQEGQVDGIIGVWYRPEREQWFVFSQPIPPPNQIGFYKRKQDKITFTKFEDLKPYVIGTIIGFVNPPEFEKATYLKREEVVTDAQNLQKLFYKRIDLALIDKGLADYIIRTQFPEYREALEWLEPAVKEEPNFLGISKKTPDYLIKLEAFNRGLAVITKEGLVGKILLKNGW